MKFSNQTHRISGLQAFIVLPTMLKTIPRPDNSLSNSYRKLDNVVNRCITSK